MENKRMFFNSLILIILIMAFMLFSFTTQSLAASYASDYRYWNQASSDYELMQKFGCWVTAQAKLLCATGVESETSFNPDIYLSWQVGNGQINSDFYQTNGAESPAYYASLKGKSLEYLGYGYSGVSDYQIWNNINAGYHTIIQVTMNNGQSHYIYVDNAMSQATGQIYIDDSYGPVPLSTTYSIRNTCYVYRVNITKPNIPSNMLNLGNNFYAYMIMSNNLDLFNVDVDSSVVLQKGVYLDKKQIWNFTRQSDGSYVIKNTATGRYLDVLNSNDYDGGGIRTFSYNGSNAQKFFLYGTQDNCVIRPACSTTRTVSVDGGHNLVGKKLNMWEYWGVETQLFNIWKVNEAKASVLNYNVNGSNLTLNWTKGENADKYDIIIKSGTVGNLKEYKKIIDIAETSYSISLPEGYYEVTVEGWNYFSNDFSNVVKFTIANNTTNINKCNIGVEKSSYVYTGTNISPKITIKNGNTTLKNGTDYTLSYKNNKDVGKATVTITGKGNYTGTVTKTFIICPLQVKNLRATSQTTNAIKYQWNAVSRATGYKVYTYNYSTGKWEYYGKTTTTAMIIKSLNPATIYKIKVRAYKNVDGIQYFGAYSTSVRSATRPANSKITSVASGNKSIAIKWRAISGATGYKIYMSTTKNGTYNKIATVPASYVKYTQTGLKSGKTYYYKVRAYKTLDGVQIFGEYSPVVAVTAK